MISFAVSGGGGAVSVRRKVVEFGGTIVGTLGHIALLGNLMRLTRTRSHAVRPGEIRRMVIEEAKARQ
jgi:hypothetical protein